jgi:riboflavin transporter FmnP
MLLILRTPPIVHLVLNSYSTDIYPLGVKFNTREIALTIVFTALAIALNPVAIPATYLPGFYRFWEIPIVAAFLLLGPKIGVAVTLLRTLAELTLFPGPAGILGPLFVLPVTLIMLFGIYLGGSLLKRKASQDKKLGVRPVTYFTALGALFRTVSAPFVMYAMYRFIIGFSDVRLMALMPLFAVFALTFSLYTIPLGYLIARVVSRSLKVGNQL